MSRLDDIRSGGVAIWLDTLSRDLLEDGDFERFRTELAITGATSNPTIFARAICGSDRYDQQLLALLESGVTDPRELFRELALEDVRRAAGVLRDVFEASDGNDGYVSLECTPDVAYDATATVEQALGLWRQLGAPNVMIKVPATEPGIAAIETLTAAGVNVNVTLLFAVARYQQVLEAYLRGLEARFHGGHPIAGIRSVASFFVSRVDAKADALLAPDSPLRGRVGIENAGRGRGRPPGHRRRARGRGCAGVLRLLPAAAHMHREARSRARGGRAPEAGRGRRMIAAGAVAVDRDASAASDEELWIASLRAAGAERDAGVARLHEVLLRAARFELSRRRAALSHVRGEELEDIATQAADDALVAVLAKLDDFRGASRFTTWAYKFAVLEAGVKLRRRAWQGREIVIDAESWPAFADRHASAQEQIEQAELLDGLRRAIADGLTPHQREVFVALALNEVPIDVLAERLSTTRGALYKTLHDARRKLRVQLASAGLTD